MKKIGLVLLSLFLLASCNFSSEGNYDDFEFQVLTKTNNDFKKQINVYSEGRMFGNDYFYDSLENSYLSLYNDKSLKAEHFNEVVFNQVSFYQAINQGKITYYDSFAEHIEILDDVIIKSYSSSYLIVDGESDLYYSLVGKNDAEKLYLLIVNTLFDNDNNQYYVITFDNEHVCYANNIFKKDNDFNLDKYLIDFEYYTNILKESDSIYYVSTIDKYGENVEYLYCFEENPTSDFNIKKIKYQKPEIEGYNNSLEVNFLDGDNYSYFTKMVSNLGEATFIKDNNYYQAKAKYNYTISDVNYYPVGYNKTKDNKAAYLLVHKINEDKTLSEKLYSIKLSDGTIGECSEDIIKAKNEIKYFEFGGDLKTFDKHYQSLYILDKKIYVLYENAAFNFYNDKGEVIFTVSNDPYLMSNIKLEGYYYFYSRYTNEIYKIDGNGHSETIDNVLEIDIGDRLSNLQQGLYYKDNSLYFYDELVEEGKNVRSVDLVSAFTFKDRIYTAIVKTNNSVYVLRVQND